MQGPRPLPALELPEAGPTSVDLVAGEHGFGGGLDQQPAGYGQQQKTRWFLAKAGEMPNRGNCRTARRNS